MQGKKDWLPQDCIDLHGFTRAEAFAVTRRFLDQAQQRGSLTVRIIHGRGTGILAEHIRKLLDTMPEQVTNYGALSPKDGSGVWVRLSGAPTRLPKAGQPRNNTPSATRDLLKAAKKLDPK
ncbi:MAG: hypothetical protein EXS02_07210 [Planctomycetes bacterium]|nr:hypothetical protein [Planctomycetota bacterium]